MNHAESDAALQAVNISLRYGQSTVLSHVALAVPRGATVGLVGRNGAGKSTLLRCLVGLSVPDSGHCEVLGQPSIDLPDTVRERLGYVAQTPDLFGWLNGEAHLQRLGALYPGYTERRAIELAALLDLPLGTQARHLSLGDQQKLSVVLALAHDPDVLILDEPVASLDPLARRNFMRALFDRRPGHRAERTVLISSHLLADLERVVSHVVFLHEGVVQLVDEWDALAEHVRLLLLPQDADLPAHGHGVLHRRVGRGQLRLVVDTRHANWAVHAAEAPLNLDDLFAELNA